ncbi:sigma-54-dependent transcriptional regulator [Candidatus Magnetaquicoccus inordinatus]|uniref:sigma-54-dependent transcriptional regulator n=1 Tax=Candidatus Magnetaquicoccus inordinatus TaxID=2496818 RepID=UPI00187D4E75|nr:sigma-54 dependent transcriptional regulator [Candidatus Magnetaquicoccus inordinatus]
MSPTQDGMAVLLVDDEEMTLHTARLWLHKAGFSSVSILNDNRQLLSRLTEIPVDVLVLDLLMPHNSGLELLPEINRIHPEIPVIVMTSSQDVEGVVECMKQGAIDYLLKPTDPDRFVTSVRNAMQLKNLRCELLAIRDRLQSGKLENQSAFAPILTHNHSMQQLFRYIEAVACSPEPLLITGETGVGKELFARAIHDASRRNGAFVAENLAGLDDQVFTDTLFGHRRGAFTGADKERKGLVAQAAGGTLFLDEIGDIGPLAQIKLLRLLQERCYLPLGSDQVLRTDARIVAATNLHLPDLVAEGRFRKDLFYRFSFHHVHVPPLRERRDDLPLLVAHFLDEASLAMGKPVPTPPHALFDHLAVYPFSGNVRELKAMIYDAVARHRGHVMSLESFRQLQPAQRSTIALAAEDDLPLRISPNRFPTMREAEEILIQEALQRSGGRKSVAAALLGLTRQALYSRLANKKGSDNAESC